jgi:agmatine deiminase
VDEERTPRDDGFRMPAEWEPHEACLMSWPYRESLWGSHLEQAKTDYAEVARAVSIFEPVVMVCNPGDEGEVANLCGSGVSPLPIPIDDSWMRDNGPIFVVDARGHAAMVHFRFNSWGGKYLPFDRDAAVPERLASHFGISRYEAPMVLEGGSFFVDGEGTLITTEQCLLNPNRNPQMSRGDIEECLRGYLGVSEVVWLGMGEVGDRDTDGHIDGIAQYVAPGRVILRVPSDPQDPDHESGRENLRRLHAARDASGRMFDVTVFEPGPPGHVPYLNFYLPNAGLVVPVAHGPQDDEALEQIRAAFIGREVVPVSGECLSVVGGGGPHCITQQVPVGVGIT